MRTQSADAWKSTKWKLEAGNLSCFAHFQWISVRQPSYTGARKASNRTIKSWPTATVLASPWRFRTRFGCGLFEVLQARIPESSGLSTSNQLIIKPNHYIAPNNPQKWMVRVNLHLNQTCRATKKGWPQSPASRPKPGEVAAASRHQDLIGKNAKRTPPKKWKSSSF